MPSTSTENLTSAPQLPPPRLYNLQKAIRQATIFFMRKTLLCLPELPDEKKFAQLRARNEELIQRRIAYEKELVLKEQQLLIGSTIGELDKQQQQFSSSLSFSSLSSSSNNTMVLIDNGFSSQTSTTELWKNMTEEERFQIMNNDNDPMAQQISIIRSYIRQARYDHRYEEVAMLEENLKELEIEYFFKQQEQQSQLQTQLQKSEYPPSAVSNHQSPSATTENLNPFCNPDDDG